MPGPAGLLASYSGTSPHMDPYHTKALAVLFTATLAARLSVPQRLDTGAGSLLEDSAAAGPCMDSNAQLQAKSALLFYLSD